MPLVENAGPELQEMDIFRPPREYCAELKKEYIK